MSPAEIRHRALLAAAKVTLSLAAFGCGAADPLPSLPTDQRTGESSCEQGGERCNAVASGGAAGAAPGEQAGGAAGAAPGGGGAQPAGGAAGQPTQPEGCGQGTTLPFKPDHVDCCVAVVKAAFPEDLGEPGPETLSAEQTACCRVLLLTRDTQEQPTTEEATPIPWEIAYRCCPYEGVLQEDPSPPNTFSPTCTPWGPPTPPPMIEELLADLSWLREVA